MLILNKINVDFFLKIELNSPRLLQEPVANGYRPICFKYPRLLNTPPGQAAFSNVAFNALNLKRIGR